MHCWERTSPWPRKIACIAVWIGCWNHKPELFVWLRQKWADLFQAEFEVLLYDLTSTYFEGAMEKNSKARYGHSRDKRTDCLQVVIALVITPDGFRLAYEVMKGNTSDRSTLRLWSSY